MYEDEIPESRGRIETERDTVLQDHFKAGHYRTIEVFLNETIGFNADENRISWEDLRFYRSRTPKRFETPVDLEWMLKAPKLADRLKKAAQLTGHHPLDPTIFSHEFFAVDEE